MRERILSVGIDIGTSTVIVIFSHIYVENVAGDYRMPDVRIVRKEVIYRSPVFFTPLVSNNELDIDGIAGIIKDEYRAAGIQPSEVKTGAVIITGDTARKSNAESVLHTISGYAGDFVVATAGPQMESILAGKGSGAEQYSIDNSGAIANLDIGGGTTNIAIFENGIVVDSDCMDIGGRLIRFRHGTSEIEYLFPKIGQLSAELGLSLTLGSTMTSEQIHAIARAMAEVALERFTDGPKSKWYHHLLTNGRQDAKEIR
ncbi:MAG: ethanolamine ammonia-lyase reactivating factor EutA, partial [Synergistaceae bacterium]|nr:ethanolamine ammonia-lyase reactivating factor EutA [Synergistaceae bacterium]